MISTLPRWLRARFEMTTRRLATLSSTFTLWSRSWSAHIDRSAPPKRTFAK